MNQGLFQLFAEVKETTIFMVDLIYAVVLTLEKIICRPHWILLQYLDSLFLFF